jgi:hypothetical protein
MSTSDIETRVTYLEGEIRGTQQVAEALFKLSDRMHEDMTAMRQELKSGIRAGHWERLGIIAAGLTIAASIYFT